MKISLKGEGEAPSVPELGHANKRQHSSTGRQPRPRDEACLSGVQPKASRGQVEWERARKTLTSKGARSHVAVELEIYTAHSAFVSKSGILLRKEEPHVHLWQLLILCGTRAPTWKICERSIFVNQIWNTLTWFCFHRIRAIAYLTVAHASR